MTDIDDAVGFGDTVRIKETPDTPQAGIAGCTGTVFGFTTPSATGVTVVGPLREDFALNVHVDALRDGFWLDPDNIELVERPEVMEFGVGGKTIRVTRKDGRYKEEIISPRPWWKFW